MVRRTGGEIVLDCLKAAGVETVFGIISVHNIPIFDALAREGGIRLVPTRSEHGAASMADGFSRATGRLARGDHQYGRGRGECRRAAARSIRRELAGAAHHGAGRLGVRRRRSGAAARGERPVDDARTCRQGGASSGPHRGHRGRHGGGGRAGAGGPTRAGVGGDSDRPAVPSGRGGAATVRDAAARRTRRERAGSGGGAAGEGEASADLGGRWRHQQWGVGGASLPGREDRRAGC